MEPFIKPDMNSFMKSKFFLTCSAIAIITYSTVSFANSTKIEEQNLNVSTNNVSLTDVNLNDEYKKSFYIGIMPTINYFFAKRHNSDNFVGYGIDGRIGYHINDKFALEFTAGMLMDTKITEKIKLPHFSQPGNTMYYADNAEVVKSLVQDGTLSPAFKIGSKFATIGFAQKIQGANEKLTFFMRASLGIGYNTLTATVPMINIRDGIITATSTKDELKNAIKNNVSKQDIEYIPSISLVSDSTIGAAFELSDSISFGLEVGVRLLGELPNKLKNDADYNDTHITYTGQLFAATAKASLSFKL